MYTPEFTSKKKTPKNPYYQESLLKATDIADSITGALAEGLGLGSRIKQEMDAYRDFDVAGSVGNTGANYGRISNIRQQVAGLKPEDAGKGLIGQSALAGAKMGATLGTINPIVGAASAFAGSVIGSIGGAIKKKQMKELATSQKNKAIEEFGMAQDQFNLNNKMYHQDVTGQRQQLAADKSYYNRSLGTSSPYQSLI